jgi:hypothetical protein
LYFPCQCCRLCMLVVSASASSFRNVPFYLVYTRYSPELRCLIFLLSLCIKYAPMLEINSISELCFFSKLNLATSRFRIATVTRLR